MFDGFSTDQGFTRWITPFCISQARPAVADAGTQSGQANASSWVMFVLGTCALTPKKGAQPCPKESRVAA